MNKFYLIAAFILYFNFSFANPVITSKQTGSWSNKSIWDKSRGPKDGDTIVIAANQTVSFDDWFSTVTLKSVYIKVFGTLKLNGLFSSLSLDNNSTIIVYSGGTLSTSGAWQNITLGGRQVFASAYPSIIGPQMANLSSNGFISISNPLPVKFVGFTVVSQSNNALIQWSTSEEINANMYEVERSEDGSNWTTIAYVAAIGNSSVVNNYSYTDKNVSAKVVYYRIKEVDYDGKTNLTAIKSIKTNTIYTTADIKIASVQNKVLLQFPKEVKGNLVVRFVSMSGQIVDQQTINNPLGQVVLNSKVSGNYVISVSNGLDINSAKQVIL